ncbi:Serpentine receptor class gamma [Caenorhabditis elegans]|uniref:Serpentine receptor class gamma n=1 Tax=Caenorhabditis elegans TaxID=6239 RepID=U4PDZ7_CAEEL|nr:Serpentine receptor class gamma [Caenorhabditis elegans]CDH92979.1 Serpentine receptor class gamma [Caenorhabditis elegans]|eukprot:NP_001294282.1 Serpentine Receptor, class V [Caenorhabditis elegans]
MPLSINLSLLPISHLIFIPICWFSVFLYLRVLYIIHQLRKNVFKSSFFLIIRMHAITDLLMFLYVELVARPRKYRVHNLFEAANDHWIPQLLWFSLTVIKNAMFLGYTVVAVNRCSEIFRFRNHVKFWSPTLILIVYLSEWLAPTIVLIPLFYTGNHNFSLIAAPSGGLFLRASPEFIKMCSRTSLYRYFASWSAHFCISSLLCIWCRLCRKLCQTHSSVLIDRNLQISTHQQT